MKDLYADEKNFLVKGDDRFKTTIGGVLTITFIVIAIISTFFISYDFLFGTNPQLSKYQEDYLNTLNWGGKMKILIGYSEDYLNRIKILRYNNSIAAYDVSNLNECLEEDFNNFSNITRNSSWKYYCKDTGNEDLNFILVECKDLKLYMKNLNETDCKVDTSKNVTRINNQTWVFGIESHNFLPDRPNPLESIVDYYYGDNNSSYNYISCPRSLNMLISDIGSVSKNVFIDYFYNLPYKKTDISKNKIFFFESVLSESFVINKSFIKLPSVIAKCMAIIQILFLIFSFVNNFLFTEYITLKYFLQLFLKNDKNVEEVRNAIEEELGKSVLLYSKGKYLIYYISFLRE
jgi:hypothetical protein